MITLYEIEKILEGHKPVLLGDDGLTTAAVAMLLREGPSGLEVLFIERAAHDNDPWSGNVGFPGGKIETADGGPQRAAERETLEEIGLDLRAERYLGRLSDMVGAHLPVRISCFIYATGSTRPFCLSEEVKDVFWVPLEELCNSMRHDEASVRFAGRTLTRPSIRLPQPGKPVLWGITYRLVMDFLELLRGNGRR